MDKYDVSKFFLAALKKELAHMGHGSQAQIAERAGISRSLLNDIVKGRSVGSEDKRRAIAAAFGFDDYETFLDIGRALMKMPAVRQGSELALKANLSNEVLDLLRENRKLRLEIDALKTELGKNPDVGMSI